MRESPEVGKKLNWRKKFWKIWIEKKIFESPEFGLGLKQIIPKSEKISFDLCNVTWNGSKNLPPKNILQFYWCIDEEVHKILRLRMKYLDWTHWLESCHQWKKYQVDSSLSSKKRRMRRKIDEFLLSKNIPSNENLSVSWGFRIFRFFKRIADKLQREIFNRLLFWTLNFPWLMVRLAT